MKHVAAVRRELGFRTIFNLLGPLSNPAGVHRQLVGVFSREWTEPVASVLKELGTERAWVVHSADGMDEISIAARTDAAVLQDGQITRREITPGGAHLPQHSLDAVRGGDAQQNARAIGELLDGAPSAFRDIVLLNTAAALVIVGTAEDLRTGAALAAEALDGGRAKEVLSRVVGFSARVGA
jgi:anthranilate phosphoribosyltransferase